MEEWRNLAKTVPSALFSVGFDIEGLLSTVTTARSDLTAMVIFVDMSLHEAPHIDDDLAAQIRHPGDHFDGAIRELARLSALHAAAGHAFALYAERVGIAGGNDALWLGWRQNHAAAHRHAEAALRMLRRAASRVRAYEDVIRTAWSLPALLPDWWAWMAASLDFVLFAKISGAMASHSLRCMRKAIALEFHDAWRVANRYATA